MQIDQLKFLTVKELSTLLKIPEGTIYYWTSKKIIPFLKFGKHIRFEYAKVLEHFKCGPSNNE